MTEVWQPSSAQFEGRWIGETQGADRPAHIWEIRQVGKYVQIDNMWEGEESFRQMTGKLVEGQAAISLTSSHRAVLVDSQHFIVAGWDAIYHRRRIVGGYDVVFSRPGIAELTAHQVWLDWKKTQPPSDSA